MRLIVSSTDIAKGNPGCHATCPIARALTRKFGGAKRVAGVSVGPATCLVELRDGTTREFLTTPDIEAYFSAFDARQPVRPATFELLEFLPLEEKSA